jgi:hypothetical protein
LREDLPQGFAIHESATISTMWPAMPCFSDSAFLQTTAAVVLAKPLGIDALLERVRLLTIR